MNDSKGKTSAVTSNGSDLLTKLKAFEVTLGLRNAVIKELKNDRARQFDISQTLQKQVRQLQEDLNKEKRRRRPEQTSLADSILGAEEEEGSSIIKHIFYSIVQTPRRAMCSVTNRITLFTWWIGLWANEGLSIFRIENKWSMLQKAKELMEQEKISLEEHLHYLQKLIEDKDDALKRERELNKALLDKLQNNDTITSDPKAFGKMIEALFQTMGNLGDSMDNLRQKIDSNGEDMEVVYEKLMSMLSNQKRLEKYERTLDEMLNHIAILFHRYNVQERVKEDKLNPCFHCSSYLGDSSSFPFDPLSESKQIWDDDVYKCDKKDKSSVSSDSNKSDLTTSDTSHSSAFGSFSINEDGSSIEEVEAFTGSANGKNKEISTKPRHVTFTEKSKQHFTAFLQSLQKSSLKINYKVLCLVLLFALLSLIVSFHFLFDKESPAPYNNIFYRLAHSFAQIWTVLLLL